jgi:hypothetical protein
MEKPYVLSFSVAGDAGPANGSYGAGGFDTDDI